MYDFLLRRGTTVAFVVGFIASLLIIFLLGGAVGDLKSDDFDNLYQLPAFDIAVLIAIVFAVIALAAILLGGAFGAITNPKASMKFVIGLVGLLVVFGILYAVGNIDDSGYKGLRDGIEEYNISSGISKMINAGLIASIALFAIAFVTILLAEVRNAFK